MWSLLFVPLFAAFTPLFLLTDHVLLAVSTGLWTVSFGLNAVMWLKRLDHTTSDNLPRSSPYVQLGARRAAPDRPKRVTETQPDEESSTPCPMCGHPENVHVHWPVDETCDGWRTAPSEARKLATPASVGDRGRN